MQIITIRARNYNNIIYTPMCACSLRPSFYRHLRTKTPMILLQCRTRIGFLRNAYLGFSCPILIKRRRRAWCIHHSCVHLSLPRRSLRALLARMTLFFRIFFRTFPSAVFDAIRALIVIYLPTHTRRRILSRRLTEIEFDFSRRAAPSAARR